MTDRILVALACGLIGWNGLFPTPPTPLTLHQKMVQQQHAKVCAKEKKRARIKELCKKWGMA